MGEFILVTGYNTNCKIMIRINNIKYCVDGKECTVIYTYDERFYEVKENAEQIFEMINQH